MFISRWRSQSRKLWMVLGKVCHCYKHTLHTLHQSSLLPGEDPAISLVPSSKQPKKYKIAVHTQNQLPQCIPGHFERLAICLPEK